MAEKRDRSLWKDPLEAAGWRFVEDCNCNGEFREEWQPEGSDLGWRIFVWPDKGKIRKARTMLLRFKVQKGVFTMDQFQEVIKLYNKLFIP